MNEVLDAIRSRRTVRNYCDSSINREQLEIIIEAGNNAPSPHNVKPWYIVGILKKQIIKQIVETYSRLIYPKHPEVAIHKRVLRCIEKSGALIMVFLPNWRKELFPKANVLYWSDLQLSIGASVQNMLLAGHSIGVGLAWLNMPVEDGFCESFSTVLNIDGKLMSFLTVGVQYSKRQMLPPKYNDEKTMLLIT